VEEADVEVENIEGNVDDELSKGILNISCQDGPEQFQEVAMVSVFWEGIPEVQASLFFKAEYQKSC